VPLTELPAWNQLLSGGPDPYGRRALALAAQLRTEDMDELITLVDHGDEKHCQVALSVLLARNGQLRNNPRFRPDQLERLAKVALRHVKESFPFEPGCSYFTILSILDPSAAGDLCCRLGNQRCMGDANFDEGVARHAKKQEVLRPITTAQFEEGPDRANGNTVS